MGEVKKGRVKCGRRGRERESKKERKKGRRGWEGGSSFRIRLIVRGGRDEALVLLLQ